jgi:tetratricopeptide (TPR) repeat protein
LHTSGSRLRIAADLSESGTGQVIWAERFEGSLAGVFDLQDQMSQAILRRVVPYVRQLELQRARSAQPETLTAYERTLRGIDHFHRSSRRDHDEARALLETAIEADSAYVTPHAWLAHWYVRRVGQGWSTIRSVTRSRRIAIRKPRWTETRPTRWRSLSAGLVAGYLQKDLEGAIELHNRALTINPSACSAWLWSTSAYAWLGEGSEAVRRSHRAIELSPLDPQMYLFTSIAGTAHAVAGSYDKAIELCRRSLRMNRMFASTHRILTLSLALAGRESEARVAAASFSSSSQPLRRLAFCGATPAATPPRAEPLPRGCPRLVFRHDLMACCRGIA